jgi:hypothetical protein
MQKFIVIIKTTKSKLIAINPIIHPSMLGENILRTQKG